MNNLSRETEEVKIEVFSTNVPDRIIADKLIDSLVKLFPGTIVSFDLEDCDHVLRVEGVNFESEVILQVVRNLGYKISYL